MQQSQVQEIALALPEVTEEPHHHRTSFRVRGKIFATAIPTEDFVNIMLGDDVREAAIGMYADCVEPLYWGKKVVGIQLNLQKSSPDIVAELLQKAWREKAPASLVKE